MSLVLFLNVMATECQHIPLGTKTHHTLTGNNIGLETKAKLFILLGVCGSRQTEGSALTLADGENQWVSLATATRVSPQTNHGCGHVEHVDIWGYVYWAGVLPTDSNRDFPFSYLELKW